MINWIDERAYFTHGWLKNNFIQNIRRLENTCIGNVTGTDLINSIKMLIEEWAMNVSTAECLIQTCIDEMSPSKLFSIEPLSNLEFKDKEALAILAHKVWLDRYNILILVKKANISLCQVKDSIELLKVFVNEAVICKANTDNYLALLYKLDDDCVKFADSMSHLPKNIMV